MSTAADIEDKASTVPEPTRHSVSRYDCFAQFTHWVTVLVLIATYTTVWLIRYADTREQANALVQLHRSLGVTVLCVTASRLVWRSVARIPPLPQDLPQLQRLAARTNEFTLYALLLLQPTLGFLHSNAAGKPVVVYFLGAIPSLLAPDRALARQLFMAHDFVAKLLLGLIALHVVAALFHHFIRGDDVLRTMLPRRRLLSTGAAGGSETL
jgi:superoxide oxidase